MKLIRGLHNLPAGFGPCVATIGNFDGVHTGHQTVFRELEQKAGQLGLPSVLICFEPQPAEYFAPGKAPARLTRLREKLEVLQQQPLDYVLLLSFDRGLAAMEATDFVEKLLLDKLSVRLLYVGDDFQFGKGRLGNIALLQSYSAIEVHSLDTHMHEGGRVSSTRIRQALKTGDLGLAEILLGRPYSICGRIAHGFQRGRTIGFPTANIAMARIQSPVHGVFAVRVHGIGNQPLNGVANVGNRPTVVGGSQYWLEVHIFDFSDTIYGELVKIELVEKLREEKKFNSFEQLKQQIVADAATARQLLACH